MNRDTSLNTATKHLLLELDIIQSKLSILKDLERINQNDWKKEHSDMLKEICKK